jgi:hypothetical protein
MSFVLLRQLEKRMAKLSQMVKEIDLDNVTDLEEAESLVEEAELASRELDVLLPYYEFVQEHSDFVGG